jgi:pimeloyl-ACP methyl ester carboxylesterase
MADTNTLSASQREQQGITLDEMLPEAAQLGTLDVNGWRLGIASIEPTVAHRANVLLVPGFTSSRSTFFCIMQQLADTGYRVVAMSQRGQPHSNGPDTTAGYTLQILGQDLVATLDALAWHEPAHLLGHSFGGLVAAEAVIQAPARWASLTLWNSGQQNMGPDKGMAEGLAGLREHGPRALWVHERLAGGLDPDADLRGELNKIEQFYFDRGMATNPAQLDVAMELLVTQVDRVDELRDTDIRALVAHGDADDAWPQEQQRADAERLGAAYAVIPRSGHSSHQDNPEDSVSELTAFWG